MPQWFQSSEGECLAVCFFISKCMAFVFSFLIAIVGLILGIVALNGMKESGNTEGKGLATAAIWISALSMVLWWIIIANA